MSEQKAEQFIAALRELEENENVDTIAALYGENSEIGNSTLTEPMHGTDGAREFWTSYRKTFGKVGSEFKNKIHSEKSSALEWTTTGTNAEGGEIVYDGVSILEFDGGVISRFHAYFNPSELGKQITEG